MSTPTVDLRQISMLTEIVLRGGDFTDPRSRESLRMQYEQPNNYYTDLAAGLSCLFRPGASLDELAREGSYPNARLSVAIVERLIDELAAVGCALTLYVTPILRFPDHHTLGVMHNGLLETTLRDEVLDALIHAMSIVSNPYRRTKR
jgi:hypothetical protein